MAIYPLAVPLMASPMGLVTLTVISANSQITTTEFVILTMMLLLVIIGINLVALLFVDGVMKYVWPEVLGFGGDVVILSRLVLVTHWIFGVSWRSMRPSDCCWWRR